MLLRTLSSFLITFYSLYAAAQTNDAIEIRGMVEQPCSDLSFLNNLPDHQSRWDTLQAHLRMNDWPYLCRYREANQALDPNVQPDVVFMGDSITEGWVNVDPSFFSQVQIGRGIGGQTTPQMVARFYHDVVALHPKAVHIMAGTNDVAGNTGNSSIDQVQNNIKAMVDLALVNNIKVILASILPADHFFWSPTVKPVAQIRALNNWLQGYAKQRGLIYVDYYSAMVNEEGGLAAALARDGVHPTAEGYALMRPLAELAIKQVLGE